MDRLRRILIVEDDKSWQEELRDALEPAGFSVETVATRPEASRQLAADLFYVLVLDIRLEDRDVTNVEGMEFLRELSTYGINEAMHVIVLTAFGTDDQMREAFRQHGVEDFIRKQSYDEDQLINEVKEVFDRKIEINLDLSIHWQHGCTPEDAVLNLWFGEIRVKHGTPQQQLIARELDDLLCRLFHTSESLLVSPLGQGRSGSGVLLAQPFLAEGGAGRWVVVKFGDYRRIQQEHDNFDRFVAPYLGGGRHTSVQGHRRGPRLGGLVYSLLGGESERLSDFATFYRTSGTDEICEALEHLFRDTCGTWYESPGQKKVMELTPHYFEWLGLSPERLEHGFRSLKAVQGNEKLYFQSLTDPQPLANPLKIFPGKPLALATYETITHGDLHPHNILLDEQGQSWLIDFQGTGRGHFLRDAVELDAGIRLTLLDDEEATLDERLALEQTLAAPVSFSELKDLASKPLGTNAAVNKAFVVCVHLRGLAGQLVARHTTTDISEYYAGALFCALNLMRFLSLPTLQREHALLSACILTKRLGL